MVLFCFEIVWKNKNVIFNKYLFRLIIVVFILYVYVYIDYIYYMFNKLNLCIYKVGCLIYILDLFVSEIFKYNNFGY